MKVILLCFPVLNRTKPQYQNIIHICDLGCLIVVICGQAIVSFVTVFLIKLSETLLKTMIGVLSRGCSLICDIRVLLLLFFCVVVLNLLVADHSWTFAQLLSYHFCLTL